MHISFTNRERSKVSNVRPAVRAVPTLLSDDQLIRLCDFVGAKRISDAAAMWHAMVTCFGISEFDPSGKNLENVEILSKSDRNK